MKERERVYGRVVVEKAGVGGAGLGGWRPEAEGRGRGKTREEVIRGERK